MALLDPLFGSAAMSELFSDAARLQRMLDFEAALARAEARCGVIPATAAQAIASKCKADLIDDNALATATPGVPAANSAFHIAADVFQEMDMKKEIDSKRKADSKKRRRP